MQVTHPFGLALSGGGFRATAYHLGVLKRLRELGLLAQVDRLSTVSGGSIAGAYWIYWQAKNGDTIGDAKQWEAFESSLIRFMRLGVREWIFRVAFVFPAVILAAIIGVLAWLFRPLGMGTLIVLASLIPLAAYIVWHYSATRWLQVFYDAFLFRGCKVSDIVNGSSTQLPGLFINATALNSGEHLFCSTIEQDWSYAGLFPDIQHAARHDGLSRQRRSVPLPSETLLSRAVAASSAIPFVFSPITFARVLTRTVGFLRKIVWDPTDLAGTYWVIDGGVFDNQGTHMLLEEGCSSIIVSDGSGALRPDPSPSSWQMFPPGKGVVARALDITYERARDLGYVRLADRHELHCMLRDVIGLLQRLGLSDEQYRQELEQFKKYTPYVTGYAYVEMTPSKHFVWRDEVPRIPDQLIKPLAEMRTDLDRFSSEEISALMFHGYTSIDHCLRAYRGDWLPPSLPPSNFTFPGRGIFRNWTAPSDEEITRAARHLAVSRYRAGLRRKAYRLSRKC